MMPLPVKCCGGLRDSCSAGSGRSVGESLTGLFPATGGAPHVAVLHPVHFAALLALATHLPAFEDKTQKRNETYNEL